MSDTGRIRRNRSGLIFLLALLLPFPLCNDSVRGEAEPVDATPTESATTAYVRELPQTYWGALHETDETDLAYSPHDGWYVMTDDPWYDVPFDMPAYELANPTLGVRPVTRPKEAAPSAGFRGGALYPKPQERVELTDPWSQK